MMLQECFKDYTLYREVSRTFQASFKEFRKAVKDVLRLLFGRFKGVSRVFQRCFKDVSFQENFHCV